MTPKEQSVEEMREKISVRCTIAGTRTRLVDRDKLAEVLCEMQEQITALLDYFKVEDFDDDEEQRVNYVGAQPSKELYKTGYLAALGDVGGRLKEFSEEYDKLSRPFAYTEMSMILTSLRDKQK